MTTIRITDEHQAETWTGELTDFLAANYLTDDERFSIQATLAAGFPYHLGGGAGVEFTIEQIMPEPLASSQTGRRAWQDATPKMRAVLNDFSASYWLKGAIIELLKRDACDAVGDAECLARLFRERLNVLLGRS